MPDNIDDIRKKLDDIDRRILKALAQRQGLVKEVSDLKLRDKKGIRDLEREEQLLNRIREIAHEVGLDHYYAEHLFREIITNSVRFQTQSLVDHQNEGVGGDLIRVSYQGTDGAYSHLAATRHFSERYSKVDAIGYDTFQQAAQALVDKKVDFAILPIENTTAGSINDTYDIVGNENIHIVGEEILKVVHCLMSVEPVELSKIRKILSHPQAIAQCTTFLSGLPRCKVESYMDTAMSAKKVLEDGDITQAAIAGAHAADLYGLHVLESDIANQSGNYTRFVVAGRQPVKVDEQIPAKTSLMMVTSNEEGSLIECLNILHKHKINMAKLESRPRMNEPFRYTFYLDIHGNIEDQEISRGLEDLSSKAEELKILGCYPKQEK